jgi:hypothetical protein
MKEIATTILENVGRAFGLLAMFAFAAVSVVPGADITKTFEFGAGTANSVSNKRTFPVPCGQRVTAVVKYYRLGDVGAQFDVPILIELREPGATAEEEDPAFETKSATAKRTEQTATLVRPPRNDRGCNLPWVVRVRPSSGQSPVAIKGSITVTYDSSARNLEVEGGYISLNKGNSVTKNVGFPSGLVQGRVVVTATWLHAIGPIPGPLPVKLKFELIDPNGTVVASHEGYPNNEISPCCSNKKMKITYQVTSCITTGISGQWKVRITNNTSDDTMNIDTTIRHTPDCP